MPTRNSASSAVATTPQVAKMPAHYAPLALSSPLLALGVVVYAVGHWDLSTPQGVLRVVLLAVLLGAVPGISAVIASRFSAICGICLDILFGLVDMIMDVLRAKADLKVSEYRLREARNRRAIQNLR